jgi:hypothetical protein
MRLHRLGPEARHLVSKELASGVIARHEPSAYERFLDECEDVVDLDELDDVCSDLLARTTRYDTAIDRIAAPLLHRALPLSRREAANAGVWRYLAVVHRPDLVRHRWENRSWATMRTRFWSPGTRHDSNAFSRLWWIAELTHEDGSYELTERILSNSSLTTQLFIRTYSDHRPTVAACAHVLGDATGPVIERVTRELYGATSTIAIDGFDTGAIADLVRSLVVETS